MKRRISKKVCERVIRAALRGEVVSYPNSKTIRAASLRMLKESRKQNRTREETCQTK